VSFDNTDTEGNPIEWLCVSGIRKHRSVKWCINPLTNIYENVVRAILLVFQELSQIMRL